MLEVDVMSLLTSRVAREQRIAWRITEDEAILVDQEEGTVLRLNDLAAKIWQRLDGQRPLDQIVDELHAVHEIDRAALEHDVVQFVHKLIRAELAARI